MRNSGTIKHPKGISAEAAKAVRTAASSSFAKAPAGNAAAADSSSGFAWAFRGRSLWVCLGLVLMILCVYAPVWNFDFVDADDPAYLYENPQVSAGLKWKGAAWAFTTL